MVNVDFASPSLILGTALIGCGVLLLNLRNFQNKVSRDADIVVAAMVSIVGSTLIFQGWRLDPLLLLCQALTTSVALWYGIETFRLRSKEADMAPPQLPPGVGPDPSLLDPAAQQAAQQQYYQQQQGFPPGAAPFLPPGRESYYSWGGPADMDAASTSGRGASQGPYAGVNSYAETIQYDYYGNPILPQEQMYGNGAYEQYGAAGGPRAQSPGDAMFGGAGGPYAAAQGPGPGPGPGVWGAVSPGGPAEYDARGFPAGPGPSYDAARAPAGPYSAAAPPVPQPAQQLPQYALPPAVRSGAGGGPEPVVDVAHGAGSGAIPSSGTESGVAALPAPGSGTNGVLWDGLRPGTGLGPSGVAALGKPGRVDLYGKIDDWE